MHTNAFNSIVKNLFVNRLFLDCEDYEAIIQVPVLLI